jgi:hypothetical protein
LPERLYISWTNNEVILVISIKSVMESIDNTEFKVRTIQSSTSVAEKIDNIKANSFDGIQHNISVSKMRMR